MTENSQRLNSLHVSLAFQACMEVSVCTLIEAGVLWLFEVCLAVAPSLMFLVCKNWLKTRVIPKYIVQPYHMVLEFGKCKRKS